MNKKTPFIPRVAILESDCCVGEGIVALLNAEPSLNFIGHAICTDSAEQLLKRTLPDVVVCDLLLGGISTVDFFTRRALQGLKFDTVYFSSSFAGSSVRRAIDSGAAGFVLKNESWHVLRHAILCAGPEKFFSAALVPPFSKDHSARHAALLEKLTKREKQILFHIGDSRGNREIANLLNVSPKTIEAHKENLKSKLAMQSAGELRHFAANWGKE